MRTFPRLQCFRAAVIRYQSCLRSRYPEGARRHTSTAAAVTEQILQVPSLPNVVLSFGSPHHNSLSTFMDYASRVHLAPTRSIYIGTHYEYTSALALLRLGFSLLRTGRTGDAGIDLMGHWALPQFPEPLPVFAQCKARNANVLCSPRHIRELEGSFQGLPAAWRNRDVLGLLITSHRATHGVLEALRRSRWPMGFLNISRTGTIEQFVWNRAATQKGLEGVGVSIRHTPKVLLLPNLVVEQGKYGSDWKVAKTRRWSRSYPDTGTVKDIQLTWMGEPIFPARDALVAETLPLADEPSAAGTMVATENTVAGAIRSRPTKAEPRKTSTLGKAKGAEILPVKRPRGRPPGSKNKVTVALEAPRKRGRPKGSKTKTSGGKD